MLPKSDSSFLGSILDMAVRSFICDVMSLRKFFLLDNAHKENCTQEQLCAIVQTLSGSLPRLSSCSLAVSADHPFRIPYFFVPRWSVPELPGRSNFDHPFSQSLLFVVPSVHLRRLLLFDYHFILPEIPNDHFDHGPMKPSHTKESMAWLPSIGR